jgi:hypothetical protein
MALDLRSVNAKIEWARKHAESVENEVMAWIQGSPYKGKPSVNRNHTLYTMTHLVLKAPSLERWALMIGDFFHNLRSALDHLVYTIAVDVTGQNPPPRARKWSFPVSRDCPDFTEKRWRVDPQNVLGDTVWTAIERVQPCHRPHPELPPLLRLLEEFDNADKHRLLQFATEDIVGGEIQNIHSARGQGLNIKEVRVYKNPQHGTPIATISFNVPTPDVKYHFEALLALNLRHEHRPCEIGLLLHQLPVEVEAVVGKVVAEISK